MSSSVSPAAGALPAAGRVCCTLLLLTLLTVLTGCSSTPPAQPDNLCQIFEEKRGWFKAAKRAEKRWGVPPQIPMAMMYQESSYRHNAAPPKRYVMGVVPWGRVSSAYGYAQAKRDTWADYRKATGNHRASRSDFNDAIDFMGWYIAKTQSVNGVSKWDAYNQYLNYHEGWGGYRSKTYNQKPWLIKVARRVESRASDYGAQLRRCRSDLDRRGFFSFLSG